MFGTKQWDESEKLRLISLVEAQPHLWNPSLKAYREKSNRESTWNSIGADMENIAGADCKKIWERLREDFCKAKARGKRRQRSNPASDEVAHKWKFEDEMSFLIPFMTTRSPSSDVKIELDDGSGDEGSSTSETAIAKKQAHYDTTSETDSQFARPIKRKVEPDLNEDMLYAQALACTLRKLDPQAKAYAKIRIQEVLYNAEFGFQGNSTTMIDPNTGAILHLHVPSNDPNSSQSA